MNKPIILYPGTYSLQDLAKLKTEHPIWQTVDIYDTQLEELFQIQFPNPSKATVTLEEFKHNAGVGELAGAWTYYPWSGILLHSLEDGFLFALRTNRNLPLITSVEQAKLSRACVGIAGMSVGSSIALSISYSGMASAIKLADFDELSTSNLNRLREPLHHVGQPKVDLVAQHIYELNPFADVQIFDQGVNDNTMQDFFLNPAVNIVIDEIDDFKVKVKLRMEAKKHKIPLLMFTSLGDNILVDVERYDTDPELALFNGLIEGVSEEILSSPTISDEDAKRYAVQLIGQQYVPTRALASLPEIGKTIVGRPQLFSTVAVDGGLSAYVVRKLLLGEEFKSGRYFVQFSTLFDLVDDSFRDTPERTELLQRITQRGSAQ